MQRMLTGVAAVALALGVWACNKKKGPVNPDSEAQVASVRNAEARTSESAAAEPPAPAATPAAVGGALGGPPVPAGGGATAGAQAGSARYDYRLFKTQWWLRKRDGTDLRLRFESPGKAVVIARFKVAGEPVTATQVCPVISDGREFVLVCGTPTYDSASKKTHKYTPDRLLLKYHGYGEIDLYEIPEGPSGKRIPVTVEGSHQLNPRGAAGGAR